MVVEGRFGSVVSIGLAIVKLLEEGRARTRIYDGDLSIPTSTRAAVHGGSRLKATGNGCVGI